MLTVERLFQLSEQTSLSDWVKQVSQITQDMGYEKNLLAIFPNRNSPIETDAAFLQTNYSTEWLEKYDSLKLGKIDPVVSHCLTKYTPLVWSPELFSVRRQKELYEEACGYGIRSGVTLPIHGANGELGLFCLVSDTSPDHQFHADAKQKLPEIACLRDYVAETANRFIKRPAQVNRKSISLTKRELECLKWSATGKSSWDIGQILNCSEAVVNFHFANIRRKFKTSSRHQALVKAIQLGFITP